MTEASGRETALKSSGGHGWKFWIGIGISAVFMFLMFRAIDFAGLMAALGEMDVRFMAPAVGSTLLSYYLRGYRWKLLLEVEKNASMRNLFRAVTIGYMANNLLPARIGELVRVYVLGEREGIDKGRVFASLVLDRLLDGLSVLCILLATLFTLRLPGEGEGVRAMLVTGGYLTAAGYLGILGFLVLLKRRTAAALRLAGKLMNPLPPRVSEKVIPLLGSFIGGIRLSSRWGNLAGLVVSSVLIWAFAVWPIDLALRSFGVVLPMTASLFIMVLLVVAVLVPASPGYFGTYHYACYLALTTFGVTGEKAAGIALVIHAINFFPITILGLYYLARDRMSLSGLGVGGGNPTTPHPPPGSGGG